MANLTLSNQGGGDLSVTGVVNNVDWLTVTEANTNASGLGSWRISVSRQGLDEGTYRTELVFNSTAGDASVTIEVRVSDEAGAMSVWFMCCLSRPSPNRSGRPPRHSIMT